MKLLDYLRRTYPGASSVDEMGEVYPDLLDPDLPETYWSDLEGEAREHWLEPDLKAMP